MRRNIAVGALLVVAGLLTAGCEGNTGVEDAKAAYGDAAAEGAEAAGALVDKGKAAGAKWLAETEALIDELPAEMQAKAGELRDQIETQQERLTEVKSKISELSPKDLVSGSGKELKDEAEKIGNRLTELTSELKSMLSEAAEG